jgi:putative transcriptional regulator
MGKCWNCGKVVSVVKDRPYHYKESGLDYVYLIGVLQYKCTCGEDYVEIPRVNELHLFIGKYIICKKASLTGEEVRFLRKELGMKSKNMAAALSMEPETYSRWENNKQDIAPCHDKTLRMMYVMSASERTGKVLSRDFQSILNDIAVGKETKKKRRVQFTPSEWLSRLDEPIFGKEVCLV